MLWSILILLFLIGLGSRKLSKSAPDDITQSSAEGQEDAEHDETPYRFLLNFCLHDQEQVERLVRAELERDPQLQREGAIRLAADRLKFAR